ncbi:DoxX family protein [Occallatibacter riparius]|uniref:DoxX family protein n=1 Tax=Occallatibacter riparius TaxID=1002689 RepID=A0A9J7BW20_9BACT|nr:DoxX family protein [Occallatibacter riparius]UWZ85205.1 DoxX family protein [Occallatibacter riparius]
MISTLIRTNHTYIYAFLRVVAALIVLPYGLQKLLGWSSSPNFGPRGIASSLAQITAKKIPKSVAWLVIIVQSFGSIALLAGFLGRIAASGLFLVFAGALIVHLPDGWTQNWFGSKKGEGIEYFVLLLAVLMVIALKGSGALSIDGWLTR